MPSNRAAISGVFADYRLVKTRGVLQLIVEVPVERQEQAFEALGFPVPGTDIHVALARLMAPAARSSEEAPVSARSEQGRHRYATATERQQALIRCCAYAKDPRFRSYLHVETEAGAVDAIRHACGIESRKEIESDPKAYAAFIRLETDYKLASGLMPEGR